MLNRQIKLHRQQGTRWIDILDVETGVMINLINPKDDTKARANIEIIAGQETTEIRPGVGFGNASFKTGIVKFTLLELLNIIRPFAPPMATFYELFVYTEGFPKYGESMVSAILQFHYDEKSMAKKEAVLDQGTIKHEMKRLVNEGSGKQIAMQKTLKRDVGWYFTLPNELEELTTVFGNMGEIIGLKGDTYYFPAQDLGVKITQDLDYVTFKHDTIVNGEIKVPHDMGMFDGAVIWEVLSAQVLANLELRKSKVRVKDIPLDWELYSAAVIGIPPQLINYGVFTWEEVAEFYLRIHSNSK